MNHLCCSQNLLSILQIYRFDFIHFVVITGNSDYKIKINFEKKKITVLNKIDIFLILRMNLCP